MTRAQSPRPDWSGQTAVVFGSGPSLTAEQLELVSKSHGTRTIAVNATALLFPWWDVAYSGDYLWWKHVAMDPRAPKLHKHPRSSLWTCDAASADRWPLSWVKGVNREGLGREGTINMLGNSGMQAVQLAYLFGARRIVLLGFDMKFGPKGEKHHHPDHPSPCVQAILPEEWIHKAKGLASDLALAGCQVTNATPGSALPWFPRGDLADLFSVKARA